MPKTSVLVTSSSSSQAATLVFLAFLFTWLPLAPLVSSQCILASYNGSVQDFFQFANGSTYAGIGRGTVDTTSILPNTVCRYEFIGPHDNSDIRDGIHQIVSRFLERFRYMCPLLFSCVFPS
jgi:hypothetical protein